MTERMQSYCKRMEEKGLVQVRIWIKKQDKERFGRRATHHQIASAKAVSEANKIPEPVHRA